MLPGQAMPAPVAHGGAVAPPKLKAGGQVAGAVRVPSDRSDARLVSALVSGVVRASDRRLEFW